MEKIQSQTPVNAYEVEWEELSIKGVYIKTLHLFPEGGSTVFIKMEPGSSFPLHDHPDSEEVYVIEGEVKVGRYQLKKGDYLLTPSETIHMSHTKEGCILLATTRKPLQFIKK